MQGLLQQVLHMQAQLATAQDELAAAEVEGGAGGGLVTARMTGAGELVGLVIDPAAVDLDDTEMLADLVLAAVRDASRAARRLAEQMMGGVTSGLTAGLSLPGLGAADLVPGSDAPRPAGPAPDPTVPGPDAPARGNPARPAPPDLA